MESPPEPMVDCAVISQPEPLLPSTGDRAEKETGHSKNFVHKLQTHAQVKPVQQKLCRLPLSVREAVTNELNELEEQGIIEKIDF